MSAPAREAYASRRIIYHQFGSKETLSAAIIAERYETLLWPSRRRAPGFRRSLSSPISFDRQSPVRDRLGGPSSRTAQTSRRLRIGRRCWLRSRCWCRRLWCRCFRHGGRCRLWRSRRSGFWRWCRRWRGFRGWRRRWCRCRGFSLWWLDLGGFALVPVHEIGSNDESEYDASQDDSEERPTAGLVVVCHSLSPTRGSLVQTRHSLPTSPPWVECRSWESPDFRGICTRERHPPRKLQPPISQLVAGRD
jgi:AcrR family transcriptional regulator